MIAGGSDNNMMRCVDQGTYHVGHRCAVILYIQLQICTVSVILGYFIVS